MLLAIAAGFRFNGSYVVENVLLHGIVLGSMTIFQSVAIDVAHATVVACKRLRTPFICVVAISRLRFERDPLMEKNGDWGKRRC